MNSGTRDLASLDRFVDSVVPEKNVSLSVEESAKTTFDEARSQRKGASVASLRKQLDADFETEDERTIPTMIHLPAATRKKLMALVSELQNKHQKRFTLSQVGAKLLEKALG